MKSACETVLSTTKIAMNAPLPRLYEDTAAVAGASGGAKAIKTIGGGGFQSEEFGRLSQTASAAIESQVLVPIKRWLDVFNALAARMKEVEALRLEVDSRRHTVIDLAAAVDKHRAKLGKVGGHDAKLEMHLDDTIKKLQHKESKLSLSVQSYQEKEQSLYNDLSTLVKDAAWLKHYISSALKVQGDALTGAAGALGSSEPSAASDMSLGTASEGVSAPVGGSQANPSMNTVKTSSIDLSASRNSGSQTGGGVEVGGLSRHNSQSEGTTNPFLSSGVISGNSGD